MDSSWVDEWKAMATNVKAALTMFFLLELLVAGLVFFFSNAFLLKFVMIYITLIFGIFWLVVLFCVKAKVRKVDDSLICFYSGIFTNVLLINGVKCDRTFMSFDYLYGQLPDGRPVSANSIFGIRIIIGT